MSSKRTPKTFRRPRSRERGPDKRPRRAYAEVAEMRARGYVQIKILAAALDVHESTVHRRISQKHYKAQCFGEKLHHPHWYVLVESVLPTLEEANPARARIDALLAELKQEQQAAQPVTAKPPKASHRQRAAAG